MGSFNPRPCARGDFRQFRCRLFRYGFNPRPCARGDGGKMEGEVILAGFNPRPCARGDGFSAVCRDREEVSIHAPARGATILMGIAGNDYMVSIHAPARGATTDREQALTHTDGFNPRPCARGDACIFLLLQLRTAFQSTPLREGRRLVGEYVGRRRGFNPRPCARGDRRDVGSFLRQWSFNPRPCARGDLCFYL